MPQAGLAMQKCSRLLENTLCILTPVSYTHLDVYKRQGEYSFFQYQQFSMEIVAEGCSKASGLKTLLDYLKVAPGEVMAIGDHTNDIEVLSMVGMGVAVANAQEEVKKIANYVTEKERAEGVEEAIRKFVLP